MSRPSRPKPLSFRRFRFINAAEVRGRTPAKGRVPHMHPRHTLAAGALALLAAFPAAAQTEPQGEAVIVTATRQPVRANELLNDVAVITREDIEKAGPQQSLGELLTQTGGVEFTTSGGRGSATSIHLRGANAGHTLVLIDGRSTRSNASKSSRAQRRRCTVRTPSAGSSRSSPNGATARPTSPATSATAPTARPRPTPA